MSDCLRTFVERLLLYMYCFDITTLYWPCPKPFYGIGWQHFSSKVLELRSSNASHSPAAQQCPDQCGFFMPAFNGRGWLGTRKSASLSRLPLTNERGGGGSCGGGGYPSCFQHGLSPALLTSSLPLHPTRG